MPNIRFAGELGPAHQKGRRPRPFFVPNPPTATARWLADSILANAATEREAAAKRMEAKHGD
jgi:hypothetical protein